MRTYKSRSRIKLIEEANKGSLTHLLKNKELTIAEKRALVEERNPFIYALGTKLIPATPKTLEEYADYIDRVHAMHERLGIGGKRADNKAIPQTE
jgi:hypothetical protein